MPPKNRKIAAGKGVESSDQGSTPASAGSTQDPVKVALYDGAALKSALDDCAKEVVIESGYEENTTTSNIRIAGGIISILIALYAQFGPGKFPANWWPVFWCVASYLVITTLLNAYLHRVEADSFLICKPRKSSPVGLRLSSHMERFDDKYTLVMSLGLPRNPDYREVKLTSSVTKFFHGDGYLSDTAFKPEVEKLLTEFEAGGAKKTQ